MGDSVIFIHQANVRPLDSMKLRGVGQNVYQ